MKALRSGVLLLAGGLGVAAGGVKAFDKMIHSSQTSGDEFDRVMTQAKSSVNAFFKSLAMGDVSNFLSNLQRIIDKAGEYYNIMDELGTSRLFSNKTLSDLETIRLTELNIAKNRKLSAEERNKHLANARKAEEDILKIINKQVETTANAAYGTVNEAMKEQGFGRDLTREEIDYFMSEINRPDYTAAAKDYSSKENAIYRREKLRRGGETVLYDKDAEIAFNKFKESAEGAFAEMAFYFTQMPDDVKSQLSEAAKLFVEKNQFIQRASTQQYELNAADARINGAFDNDKEIVLTEDQKIKLDNQGLSNDVKRAIEEKIKDDPIQVSAPIEVSPYVLSGTTEEDGEAWDISGSIAATQEKIHDVTMKYNYATTDEMRAIYAKQKADLEAHLNEMTNTNEALLDISQMASGLLQSAMSEAFESIGEMAASSDAGDAFKNMLIGLMDLLRQFGASIIAAGMAKIAFDKLLSNPPLAIAAGAALIAATSIAKSKLQKATSMASGGIVYGETFARVGEYPGAASNPEVVAPLNKLRELIRPKDDGGFSGNVVFRIEGRELVGVLNNYNTRQNRIG
ncbi:MAG: hypothetical protein LBR26_09470 [Prevotella sp.]|nr:hypothetical protein [Prevotella sp.]